MIRFMSLTVKSRLQRTLLEQGKKLTKVAFYEYHVESRMFWNIKLLEIKSIKKSRNGNIKIVIELQ